MFHPEGISKRRPTLLNENKLAHSAHSIIKMYDYMNLKVPSNMLSNYRQRYASSSRSLLHMEYTLTRQQ